MERHRSVRHEKISEESLMSSVNSLFLPVLPLVPLLFSPFCHHHCKVSLLFAFSNYQGVTVGFHDPPPPPSDIMLTILNLEKKENHFPFVCRENYWS